MIFFDFDGTVVNVWPRYYRVFLAASELTGISQYDYIEAKRALISDEKVARHFGKDIPSQYFARKRALLECDGYLRLDTLLVSATELNAFFSRFECRLLTQRRRFQAFFEELKDLGLGCLSNQAIVLNPDQGISKKMFLKKNFPQSNHIVVGDSESEWEAAALRNIHTVLVETGLRRPGDFPLSTRHTVVPSISAFIMSYIGREILP